MTSSESFDVEALQAEVLKWQERVPKLAAALRERTEELAAARDELRELRLKTERGDESSGEADARVRARNELIEELQNKVDGAVARHRTAASEVHTLQMDLQSAQEDAVSWKSKWQSVTRNLDEAVNAKSEVNTRLEQARSGWASERESLLEDHRTELKQHEQNVASLRSRNENLIETTELANKQIASLGEELTHLVEQVNSSQSQISALQGELAAAATNREEQARATDELTQSRQELSEELAASRAEAQRRATALAELELRFSTLTAELNTEQQNNARLVRQLDQRDEALEQSRAQLAASEQGAHASGDKLRAVTSELSAVQSQFERVRREREVEQRSALQDLEKLADRCADAQTRIDQLEAELVEHKQAATELASVKHQRDAVRAELEGVTNKLVEQSHALRQHQQTATALTAMTRERDALRVAAAALKAQVEELERALQAAADTAEDLSAISTQRDVLLAETAQLKEHVHELENALQAQARTADDLAAVSAQRDAAVAELTELKGSIAALEQARDEAGEALGKAAQTAEELRTLNSAHAEVEAEVARLNECLQQAQAHAERREIERRELGEQLSKLRNANAKLERHLEERSKIVRELEAAQHAVDDRDARHDQKLADYEDRIDVLDRELKEVSHRCTTYKDHSTMLEDKLTSQQNLMQSLERELSDTSAELTHTQQQVASAQRLTQEGQADSEQRLKQAQRIADGLQSKNEELETALAGANTTVDELKAQLSDLMQAKNLAETQIENITCEMDALQAQKAQANQQEVAQLQSALNRLAEELQAAKDVQPNDALIAQALRDGANGELSAAGLEEMKELKRVLRKRTEEVDDLRWRLEQSSVEPDDRMLMILNQQLKDAREENERLNARLVKFEENRAKRASAREDDLTQIKGIGAVLAEQLRAAGVRTFSQVAALEAGVLEDPEHPLHNFYSRVVRDDWAKQARALIDN